VLIRLAALALIASAPLAALAAQAAAPSSTSERSAPGSYTEDQAARGKTAYDANCASCHETSFHTDEQFRHNWFGRTAFDLFKRLKTTMPDDNPGGLSDEEYTRVIAYILKLNGFAPGTDSLAADSTSLKLIRIRTSPADTTKHLPQ
jgi:mono/diheme cytochrome c family protein